MLIQRSIKSSYMTSGIKDTSKKYSISLPFRLASKIDALNKIHPQKTRSQLIVDLIDFGLAQVEHIATHPAAEMPLYHPDTKQAIYLLNGPFAEFHGLIRKHHLAKEREVDEDDSELLYPIDEYSLGRW